MTRESGGSVTPYWGSFKKIPFDWKAFLAYGFIFTWLAGVGRYWDNPRAELWQIMGLGSIAYVFVLALIIWGVRKAAAR